MDRSFAQSVPLLLARFEAQKIIKQIPAVQTRLLREEKFDRDTPVWAVPWWFGEKVEVKRASPEEIEQAKKRAGEMKLYAMRIPFTAEPLNLEWRDHAGASSRTWLRS
jgi:hypothetical protein